MTLAEALGFPSLADDNVRRQWRYDAKPCKLEKFVWRSSGFQVSSDGKHNIMQETIVQAPHRYGAPSRRTHMYPEVVLPCINNDRLTIVDVVGIIRGECYLWGVVAGNPDGINAGREMRQLDAAATYFFRNLLSLKAEPHRFLAYWDCGDVQVRKQPPLNLDPGERGMFQRTI
jgi:hypothetical protein